ncbi:MAG: hypothetical protein K2L13_02890 [Opitutales bacterium]|nr:hypothetical protein [Opitutales bacterium]
MPEFKEEVGQSNDLSVENTNVGGEGKTGKSSRARYALKRGRIPTQKKNVAATSAAGVGEIDASAVQSDAIGVGCGGKGHCSKKSTKVVEKNSKSKKPMCGCKAQGSSAQKKEGEPKACCKCKIFGGLFKKVFRFFGLCKKTKQPEKQVRSYRHRSRNQRRRRPQTGSH